MQIFDTIDIFFCKEGWEGKERLKRRKRRSKLKLVSLKVRGSRVVRRIRLLRRGVVRFWVG